MQEFFDGVMGFIANVEMVINEVFRVVSEIIAKVNDLNAEDAE